MSQKIPTLHLFFYCCFELQWEDSSLKAHKSHPQAGIHTLLSSVGGDVVVKMHSKIAVVSLHPMFAVVFCYQLAVAFSVVWALMFLWQQRLLIGAVGMHVWVMVFYFQSEVDLSVGCVHCWCVIMYC